MPTINRFRASKRASFLASSQFNGESPHYHSIKMIHSKAPSKRSRLPFRLRFMRKSEKSLFEEKGNTAEPTRQRRSQTESRGLCLDSVLLREREGYGATAVQRMIWRPGLG